MVSAASGLSEALVIFLLGCFCLSGAAPAGSSASQWYTVHLSPTGGYYVRSGRDSSGVAWTEYADERTANGWTRLNLESNPAFADDVQAYGAGYLEGMLTVQLIWDSWYNYIQNAWNGTIPYVINTFFQQNVAWMNTQVASLADSDPYWRHVSLVLAQLNGMQAGYTSANSNPNQNLTVLAFHIMNAEGDIGTLSNKFNVGQPETALKRFLQGAHCSSLVKVSPDLTELYAGHTTWTSYYFMLRTFKTYNLPFAAAMTSARSSLFSSFPATLSSTDDFYQLSTNLVVMETTNGIWNKALYGLVHHTSLLSWIRVIVANRMATDGESWVQIFSKYNSGTYNNQWIIVDYNKFKPGSPLLPGTGLLWIAEQIPGKVEAADMTSVLEFGYWPSYNVPYFPSIFSASGWNDAVRQYGDFMTHSLAPRAQIFRRDADSVNSMQDFMKILRYNNWQHDPLSYGDPANQISSRFDLEPQQSQRSPFGGIDSKATSLANLKLGVVVAQSGPTHDNQPPFNWNSTNWGQAREGMPDVWDFGWVFMPSGNPVQ